MARVLVTSFEPFGGQSVNSSLEVGRLLSERPLEGVAIDWLVLPVVALECVQHAWTHIESHRPDLVLALGQAGTSPRLRLEDRAMNFDHFSFADNGGNLRVAQPVVPGGPALHRTQVPIPAILLRLHHLALPVEHSFSAGSYVCNHYYYHLLHRAAALQPAPRILFVHLPYLPSQPRPNPGVHARPLEEQVECVRQILRTCLG